MYVWVGVGFLLGQNSNLISILVDRLLLPLYTLFVLLYLASQGLFLYLRQPAQAKASTAISAPTNDIPKSVVTTTTTTTTITPELLLVSTDEHPVNLTGAWKLIDNKNFEEFLAAQGVPWALRSAANKARPVHRITHAGYSLTIKIEGIIESQTTYTINGPPVQVTVRGRRFEDRVSYLPKEERGVQVEKRALEEGYTVRVCRRLSANNQTITLTSTALFDDPAKDPIESIQTFQRVE